MASRWTIGKKLIGSFLGIALIFLLFGIFAQNTIREIKIKGPLYGQIIDNKDLIADILPPPAYIIESYLCAMEVATVEEDPQAREKLLVRLQELANGSGYFRERMDFWRSHLQDQQIRSVFLEGAEQHARAFFTIVAGEFATAVRNNQIDQARKIFLNQLKPEYLQHRQAIDQVVALANANFLKLEKQASDVLHWRQYGMVIGFLAVVVLALTLGLLISRGISKPITAGVAILEHIAQGDMLQQVPVALRQRGDEIGQMAHSLQTMTQQLGALIRDIVHGVHRLTSSSNDLAVISRQLYSSAEQSEARSGMVATAAEAMSTNIQSVAAATAQSTTNVNRVASSTEEMIATINEIAQSAENARTISEGAVKQAQLTSEKMVSLGDSARNIGRVTETITEISEQTNLLALNATIEAARAGEAGKGFAVVANEIKELAKQTAAATINIKNQINEMQATTTITVEDIGTISQVIIEINNVIGGIAAAVEEQSVASSHISANLAQVSFGMGEINDNVGQSTGVIAEIAGDIASISHQSTQLKEGSGQVQVSAQGLSDLAVELEKLAEKFKV